MKEKRTSASLFGLFMSDFLDDEEESSDEDFRVEDHAEQSEDDDESDEDNEGGSNDDSSESGSGSSDESKKNAAGSKGKGKNSVSASKETTSAAATSNAATTTTERLNEHTKNSMAITAKLLNTPVCCACLGDRSDDSNEIVECDGCKITVHEGCYGISDTISVSSTVSSCSTEPWFCDPCKANIKDPDCELCPNKGGIFKETDCGKWVHLVCALYVPGVAFGEVDQLSSVTLFEMQYNKWGAKICSLCEDDHFARTGVCIGCDAGMCRSYFHATCAQREGLLSEAHHEEADHADPFYAHCKVHSDKFLIKHRKKNYNALLMQTKRHEVEAEESKNEKPTEAQERIERKLRKHRIKYATNKLNRPEPWVPTQKMPRALITSASAVKKLAKKAEIMEINTVALEFEEAQIASLTDIRKKWHIPAAFTTEFVGYYLDRQIRMKEMKTNLEQQVGVNKSLLGQQSILRTKYDDAIKTNHEVQQRQRELLSEIEMLHSSILAISPHKQLTSVESIGRPPVPASLRINTSSPAPTLSSTPPPQLITSRTMSVPTAAALKQGVGFPLNNLRKDDTGRILSTQCVNNDELLNECGICKKCNDQHLLAKCDTCHLYYHLGCLNPPLTRHPKRSKLYAWQCSECDKSDDSAPENIIIPKGPRRSRNIRYSKDGIIHPETSAAAAALYLNDSFGSDQSLALSRKSEETYHPATAEMPNGSDINLTDHELEAHVKETLETESKSAKLSGGTAISTSATTGVLKRKRERKPRTAVGSKAKPLKSSLADDNNDESKMLTPPIIQPEHQEQQQESAVEPPGATTTTIELKPLNLSIQPPPPPPSMPTEATNAEKLQPLQIAAAVEKKPKRGRPPKKSPNDMPKQEIPKADSPLLDLSTPKIECPLDQYRAFADIPNSSIPYPVPNEMPKLLADEPEIIPILTQSSSGTSVTTTSSNGVNGNQLTNGDAVLEYHSTSGSSVHHKHKKRKSHKRRHSDSPSPNGDRQSSAKKHKRKHKHKDHDAPENPTQESSSSRPIEGGEQGGVFEQPRIKMKFRAILQAGDDKKPPKFLWHVPHEENDMSNGGGGAASSAGTSGIMIPESDQMQNLTVGNGHHSEASPRKKRKIQEVPVKKAHLLLKISPNKNQELQTKIIASTSTTPTNIESQAAAAGVLSKSLPLSSQICDVCNMVGVSQNLVKCDECQKNYHFHCLIPPLKKTPKRRGYSWHCADCDPTD